MRGGKGLMRGGKGLMRGKGLTQVEEIESDSGKDGICAG